MRIKADTTKLADRSLGDSDDALDSRLTRMLYGGEVWDMFSHRQSCRPTLPTASELFQFALAQFVDE